MPDFYNALINGQYTGLVQFKPISAPGTWLGDGNEEALFPLVSTPYKWNIVRGGGGYTYFGHNESIYSNWVYCANRNMCCSAQNYGGSILKHWNWDGKGLAPWDLGTTNAAISFFAMSRRLGAEQGKQCENEIDHKTP